ncbi:cation transporter [bacterium]|nr:cation transporter [bacterium]
MRITMQIALLLIMGLTLFALTGCPNSAPAEDTPIASANPGTNNSAESNQASTLATEEGAQCEECGADCDKSCEGECDGHCKDEAKEPLQPGEADVCEECDGECDQDCGDCELIEQEAADKGTTVAKDEEGDADEAAEEEGCGDDGGCASCASGAGETDAPAEVPAGMTRVTLKIENMTCAGKSGWVNKLFGGLEGVAGSYANPQTQVCVVDFDAAKLDAAKLIELVNSESDGFFIATEM